MIHLNEQGLDKLKYDNPIESKPTENSDITPWLNRILDGDCITRLADIPSESVDMIFADPPYNLQLTKPIYRFYENSKVESCNDDWDKFGSFEDYDEFTDKWLTACRRVLKPDGTIWVIGSFHNIFRVGTIIQNLDFWILNDVIWVKSNPLPNFLGKRLTNAHETLIWASKGKNADYKFNYDALKTFNEDKQMRSDWYFPLCKGKERLKSDLGEKVHNTQKPESLLYRILLTSTSPGDIVLDPFFGSGTTGAVAKMLGRNFIGIEQEQRYVEAAQSRIDAIVPFEHDTLQIQQKKPKEVRIPFGSLIEHGVIQPGTYLTDSKGNNRALVRIDGSLEYNGVTGSIHGIGAMVKGLDSCNGWTFWHVNLQDELVLIDQLRIDFRKIHAV